MTGRPKVCVVGAGIIGLSTAVSLQMSGLDAEVTVLADRFSPETTSDVAGGLWTPHALGNTPISLIRRWGEVTYKQFQRLFMSEQCSQTGITQLGGYFLHRSRGNDMNPDWKDIVGNFSVLTPTELEQFPGMTEGFFYTSFVCESTIYLERLLNQFRKHKGKLIKRRVSILQEIAEEYDVIVNCSGAGAHQLAVDKEIDPIRGQVIQVRAPWIKCFYIDADLNAYLIPGVTKVTVGGTHQQSRWDVVPNEKDAEDIWRKSCDLFPSLKGAEVLRNVAGLRPGREVSVRLERGEDITCGGRNVPVIHNYGHGGSGITLHLGCARDAVQLVTSALTELSTRAKL